MEEGGAADLQRVESRRPQLSLHLQAVALRLGQLGLQLLHLQHNVMDISFSHSDNQSHVENEVSRIHPNVFI